MLQISFFGVLHAVLKGIGFGVLPIASFSLGVGLQGHLQRLEHVLVSALGGYTLVLFRLVLVCRMVGLTWLFSMIVSTFGWLAQSGDNVRLDLFD